MCTWFLIPVYHWFKFLFLLLLITAYRFLELVTTSQQQQDQGDWGVVNEESFEQLFVMTKAIR